MNSDEKGHFCKVDVTLLMLSEIMNTIICQSRIIRQQKGIKISQSLMLTQDALNDPMQGKKNCAKHITI